MQFKTILLTIVLFTVLSVKGQEVFNTKYTLNEQGYGFESFTTRIYIGKKEIHIAEPGSIQTYKIKKRKFEDGWMMYKVKNFWIKQMPCFVKLEFGRKKFIMYCGI